MPPQRMSTAQTGRRRFLLGPRVGVEALFLDSSFALAIAFAQCGHAGFWVRVGVRRMLGFGPVPARGCKLCN